MGRIDQIEADYQAALAALAWQVDLGVDCAVQDFPVNRYEAVNPPPLAARAGVAFAHAANPSVPDPTASGLTASDPAVPDPAGPATDHVAEAVAAAAQAGTLPALRAALEAWPHCEARQGARNLVFGGGTAGARVMVVGDVPDVDEDRQGTPFVGAKGALLDAMFAAIGLARHADDPALGIYLATALPWRPVGQPRPQDIAMLRPFMLRHIALARPEIVVAMGRDALFVLAGAEDQRTRGTWATIAGRPLLAMQHPGDLIRAPAAKSDAWVDLLALKARLAKGPIP